ncbi:hypothetical protein DL96DRAFT_127660 [Flagelloscypha sp. PMI_526]|nr:hypothetical protein DL96DRAFT_127660 [Flagelloscypha sp. PMI_526]
MSNGNPQSVDQVPIISPDDLRTIADFGSIILRDLINLVVAALIYGVYICLFTISTRTLLRRWKGSSSSFLLMVLSTTVFIFQSLRIPVYLYLVTKEINILLRSSDDSALKHRLDALMHPSISHVTAILHWVRAITMAVADAIVVWRACAMPNRNRTIALALTCFMILNAGNLTVYPFMATFAKAWMREHDQLVQIQYSSGLLSSVATNFFATTLIGWMAWHNHKSSKGIIGISRDPQIEKILVTLIETGIIYLILQLVNTLLSLNIPTHLLQQDGGISIVLDVIDEIINGFAAVSPLIVILVVQDDKSLVGRTSTELSAFSAKPPTERGQTGATNFSVILSEHLGIPTSTSTEAYCNEPPR